MQPPGDHMHPHRLRRLSLLSLVYAFFILLPVLGVITERTHGSFGMITPRQLGLLVNSIKLAFVSAILSSFLGFFLALRIHTGALRNKWYRFYFLLLLPTPFYVYALMWMYGANSIIGFIGGSLARILSGFLPAVLVETLAFFPITTLFALLGIESISREKLEAAIILTPANEVALRIILKMILPYLAAGAGFIIILSMSDFSVPSMFQYNTYMLDLFSTYSRTGSVRTVFLYSLYMVPIVLIPFYWVLNIIHKSDTGHTEDMIRPIKLTGLMKYLSYIAGGLSIAQCVIPFFVLIVTTDIPTFVEAGRKSGAAIGTSLAVSAVAALIAVLISIFPAIMISHHAFRLLPELFLFPMIIPGPMSAMGLLRVINASPFYAIERTMILCSIGCAIKFAPIALAVIYVYHRRVNRKGMEIAEITASNERTSLILEYRMIVPAKIISCVLVLFMTYAEEGIFLILMTPGRESITVKIYNYLHYGASEYVSAFCIVSILVILLIELLVVLLCRITLIKEHA